MLVLAEEGGGGKIKLLEREAYEGMDACVMLVLSLLLKTVFTHRANFLF